MNPAVLPFQLSLNHLPKLSSFFHRGHLLNMSDHSFHSQVWRVEGVASQYSFFEKFTAPAAEAVISQCGLLTTQVTQSNSPLVILDSACGTGIITSLIFESAALQNYDLDVTSGDLSPALV